MNPKYALFSVLALALMALPSCNEDGSIALGAARRSSSGLEPGINYMQPMKWKMTYRYRVQEVIPAIKHFKPRPLAAGSDIKGVGPGTYEVWFAGPREGEGVRNVKIVETIPEPTSIAKGGDTDVEFVYYDFSPGNQLPDQITATVSWEFITFERYTHWEGMPHNPYNKESALYQEYTKEEAPINYQIEMEDVAQKIYDEAKGDPMQTALGCYNYILTNFRYDYMQGSWIFISGMEALADADRSWENKHGVCDEFAAVLCSMLRSVGIPARPSYGLCHSVVTPPPGEDEIAGIVGDYVKTYGPILIAAGHAWTEFYMEDVGWIPVDPTWGQSTEASKPVAAAYSKKGNSRKIPMVDYYFGKLDPYRIPWFKDFNYELAPAPKTPDADPDQRWMFAFTERTSGVKDMIHGWPGAYGMGGG